MAWGNHPTIINPAIAGATKRKTDVLDSRFLALHDQINIWRECYIPNEDVNCGLTVGCNGSVVRDPKVRAIVADQISDNPSAIDGLCPISIPMEVCTLLREEYEKFDRLTAQVEEFPETK